MASIVGYVGMLGFFLMLGGVTVGYVEPDVVKTPMLICLLGSLALFALDRFLSHGFAGNPFPQRRPPANYRNQYHRGPYDNF